METTTTAQAIFTSMVQLHEITLLAIMLVAMLGCYLIGYYHGQLDLLKEHGIRLQTYPQEVETEEQEQTATRNQKPDQREVLVEAKREPQSVERLDEEMRNYLLRENANI